MPGQGMLSGAGHRLPGGIPTAPPPPATAKRYVVGTKRLKVGAGWLDPGDPIPDDVIASIPRLDGWIRARRIQPAA